MSRLHSCTDTILTDTVLMVPPRHFAFNTQTSADNAFQHKPDMSNATLRERVMAEFDAMVARLRNDGMSVITFDSHDSIQGQEQETPDAVFPNNWVTTHPEGDVFLYPMHTPNRRAEVKPDALHVLLQQNGFNVRQMAFVGGPAETVRALEGTGVMVFDRLHQRIYAALSERCDEALLHDFASIAGARDVIAFNTAGSTGTPVYHTNVLMSIGQSTAVICSECIVEEERAGVISALSDTHTIIDISMAQMEQQFCGNVLQLKNKKGEPVWVMSESAYQGFTPAQRKIFEQDSTLCVNAIPLIEQVGGGSCRCMLAEIFLPR